VHVGSHADLFENSVSPVARRLVHRESPPPALRRNRTATPLALASVRVDGRRLCGSDANCKGSRGSAQHDGFGSFQAARGCLNAHSIPHATSGLLTLLVSPNGVREWIRAGRNPLWLSKRLRQRRPARMVFLVVTALYCAADVSRA